jgi:hypothetical protein
MPELVSIDDMVTQVRSRTDQEQTTHITDTEIRAWLNAGIAKVYHMLFVRDPVWYLATGQVSAVAGIQEYTLPEDFMSMVGVSYTSGGITVGVKAVTFPERHNRQIPAPGVVRYRIQRSGTDGTGVRIRFEPAPQNQVYDYEYVPRPPTLAQGEDWDGIAGFAEYPIELACAKVRVKVEEDPGPHLQAMAEEKADIMKMGTRRNVGGDAPRISRTRRSRRSRYARRGIGVP